MQLFLVTGLIRQMYEPLLPFKHKTRLVQAESERDAINKFQEFYWERNYTTCGVEAEEAIT